MDSELTIDELTEKMMAKFEEKMQAKKAAEEAEQKKLADEKAKAEAEVKEKQEAKELDYEKLSEMLAAKMQPKVKGDSEKSEKAFDGAPATLKHKLKKDDQDLVDLATSTHTKGELVFPFDLYEGEDRLVQHFRKTGGKADLDGASNYGADILPQTFGTDLYMRLFSNHGNLASYVRKVPMTTYKHNIAELLPNITVSAYSSYADQNTAISNVTATAPITDNLELVAKKFVAKTNIYNDLESDVIVNLIRGVRQYMAAEFAKAQSSALLNGDTSTPHMDEDYAALSNIPEKMFKGLRKLTLAGGLGVDGTDAAYTIANLISVHATMKKYAKGNQKRFCKWIFGDAATSKLVGLLLAQTSAPMMADYVYKEGEIQKLLGIDVLYSDLMREDLEVDGYADSTGTDGNQGYIQLANFNEFVMGLRQNVVVKMVDDPLNDKRVMQGTMRLDFAPFETPSTTISTLAGLYGFTN